MSHATGAGRYAPSPSGNLHFGNLRTALLSWIFARQTGRKFILRVEDIDTQRSHDDYAATQIRDLAQIGLDWDGEVIYQHDRFNAYEKALQTLIDKGLVYECYCSRKDIRSASEAPHVLPGCYPGTCRNLSDMERAVKREELAGNNRVPHLRLKAGTKTFTVTDLLLDELTYPDHRFTGEVDDFVLRRGGEEPAWAYNLAVVIDDSWSGVDQVVRGDDLLHSAPRQAYLATLFGMTPPTYMHVPLVVTDKGIRLAKRDGAVTMDQMLKHHSVTDIVMHLGKSIGVPGATSAGEILERFSLDSFPRAPYIWR